MRRPSCPRLVQPAARELGAERQLLFAPAAADRIVAACADEGAELLVIGSHGRTAAALDTVVCLAHEQLSEVLAAVRTWTRGL